MVRDWVDKLIVWWAGVVTRRPVFVLGVAAAVAGLSLWVTVTRLTFQPDRNDLLDPSVPWNRRFVAYQSDFPGDDDLLVVVKVPAGPDGPPRARAFVRELATALAAKHDRVAAVKWGFDESRASPAAVRILPWTEFEGAVRQVGDAKTVLEAPDINSFVGGIARRLREGGRETTSARAIEDIRGLDRVVALVEDTFRGGDPAAGFRHLDGDGRDTWHYLDSDDGKLLFIKIRPERAQDELDAMAPTVRVARELVAQTMTRHPGIEAGLSGVPVIEHDETTISMSDSSWCSVVSIVGILVLMMLAHRGWRLTLLAMTALIVGMIWSFGFLTVAVGHLQILSVAFTSILLGLGIDYGIYLGTRYEVERRAHPEGREGFRATLIETFRTTGPGVVTGAVTPALAFGTTLFTDFKGMAEMGLIAGVGILLCLVAALTVFPALLRLCLSEPRHVEVRNAQGWNFFDARWTQPFVRRPLVTVIVAGVLIALAAPAIRKIRYDYNLMDLQAEGTPSVIWQELIFEHASQAIWSGASIAPTLEVARERTARLQTMPTVASVGGVGLLFPPDEPRKLALLATIREPLRAALEGPASRATAATPAQLATELQALALGITVALGQVGPSDAALRDALTALRERLQRTGLLITRGEAGDVRTRFDGLQASFSGWRESVRTRVAATLDPRPLRPDDLPEVLRQDVVGKDGRFLVKVFPAGDVWEPKRMEAFLGDLRSVDPDVTGPPVQVYLSALLIRDSYAWAGLYAFVAVLIALLIDFRRLGDALLALLPVGLSFILTFAVMLASGTQINPANIIILPLLFGIGVESGVHMLHRDRLHPDAQPPGLSAGTGKGVVLATMTTIMGFASMMLGHHRGMRSLGFVVSVGMTGILLLCLFLMPAVLQLRRNWRARRDAGGGSSAS